MIKMSLFVRGMNIKYFVFSLALIFLLALPVHAEEQEKFFLDADRVSFEDATGIARAEGNVRLQNKYIRLYAPYVQYDTGAQIIKAYSDNRNPITFVASGNKLVGKSLQYNTITRKGVLANVSGKMDAIFLRGRNLEIMPLEEAVKHKLLSRRQAELGGGNKMFARWSNVESTTCNLPNPHYKLVAKQVLVLPDSRIIIKKPKVYLGNAMLFQYPFDYVAKLKHGRSQSNIMPFVGYDSDKGLGVGISTPISWESGDFRGDIFYWSGGIWEARLYAAQNITEDLSIFGGTERTYNKDNKETIWRPQWGVKYVKNGWSAMLKETRKELWETEMRPGKEVRYNLSRSPELLLETPWFNDPAAGGYYRLCGTWGKYEDNVLPGQSAIERYGLAVQIYGEPQFASAGFGFFYNAQYGYYGYNDRADSTQKILEGIVGVRWMIGSIGMETAYVRRWVKGKSPMYWDRYLDREDIYHKISLAVPGSGPFETWHFSVRGAYDLIDNYISELIYEVKYERHCLTWGLWARQNRIKDSLSIGLSFTINAYPLNELRVGEKDIFDPFEIPEGIKEAKENR